MKSLLSLLILLTGIAQASTLKIPLTNQKNVVVSVLEVSADKVSIEAAHHTYWNLFKLNNGLESVIPGNEGACYTGNPTEVVTIVAQLADSVYSDQLGIWGYKVNNETHLIEAKDQKKNFLNEQSVEWKNWSSKNDSILILTHQSDDGDDVNAGVITKCE